MSLSRAHACSVSYDAILCLVNSEVARLFARVPFKRLPYNMSCKAT